MTTDRLTTIAKTSAQTARRGVFDETVTVRRLPVQEGARVELFDPMKFSMDGLLDSPRDLCELWMTRHERSTIRTGPEHRTNARGTRVAGRHGKHETWQIGGRESGSRRTCG